MRIATVSTVLLIAVVFGCKSTSLVEDNDLGSLRGTINLYGGTNCALLSDRSGVKIQIEGTMFSAMTDSTGHWSMSDVPAGSYDILMVTPTHDTTIILEYQFSGAGTQFLQGQPLYEVKLRGLDSIAIVSVVVTRDSTNSPSGYWNYIITSTLTLFGPDTGLSSVLGLTDLTRGNYMQPTSRNFQISKSTLNITETFIHLPLVLHNVGDTIRSYTGGDSIITRIDTSFHSLTTPQPGDTVQLVTIADTPPNACGFGGGRYMCNRKFILP